MPGLGSTPPANFTQGDSTALLSGFDSIYIGYFGEVDMSLIDAFLEGRDTVSIDAHSFKARTALRSPYSFTLDNECLNLALGNRTSSVYSPSVYVQMKSEFIWSRGVISAYQETVKLMQRIFTKGISGEKVSRADLFADFFWEENFDETHLRSFVSRAKLKSLVMSGEQVEGFVVGKGNLLARIYNKTWEIHSSGKYWLYDLWGSDKEINVWRVEFQFRRDYLKRWDIETFSDLYNNRQSLWDYASGKWVSMRAREKNNVTRRNLTQFWKQVQDTLIGPQETMSECLIIPPVRSSIDERQIVNIMAGLVNRYANLSGIESLTLAFLDLIPEVQERLIVRDKARRRKQELSKQAV